MGKPSPPKPPDPYETAGAQQQTNYFTSLMNQSLGTTDQITPYGTLSYTQTGTQSITAPDGTVYDVPQYSAEVALSDDAQAAVDANIGASRNMAELARRQSRRLNKFLRGGGIDVSGLPKAGSIDAVTAPEYSGPSGVSLDYQSRIADAGDITRSYGTDFSDDRRRVERAMMHRMNPQIERDRESLRTSLANQGIREGSAAYDRAMSRVGEQANDARIQAILAGGQEQSRLADLEARRAKFENAAQAQAFGQNSAQATMANSALDRRNAMQFGLSEADNAAQTDMFNAQMAMEQARTGNRQSALQELFALRNQPLNEITAAMSGSQVQQPSFVNAPGVQMDNVDQAGLIMDEYNARLQNYQIQQQQQQSLLGGLLGLGGSLIGAFSDERMKEDIEKIGKTDDGQNIYSFRYKGSPKTEIGLMAQEVRKRKPEAVMEGPGGLMMVDYKKATS